MSLNLTDNEKDLLRKLVEASREGILPDYFLVSSRKNIHAHNQFINSIQLQNQRSIEFLERSALDHLCEIDPQPVSCRLNNSGTAYLYSLRQAASDLVDRNFQSEENMDEILQSILRVIRDNTVDSSYVSIETIAEKLNLGWEDLESYLDHLKKRAFISFHPAFGSPSVKLDPPGRLYLNHPTSFQQEASSHIAIGNIINSVTGNVQGVGQANAQISQIVNDPSSLQDTVDQLIEKLIEEVKSDLTGNNLIEYIKATDDLKQQLVTKTPLNPSLFRKLISTISFLDSANGTLSLTAKVWPYVGFLIQMATEMSKNL